MSICIILNLFACVCVCVAVFQVKAAITDPDLQIYGNFFPCRGSFLLVAALLSLDQDVSCFCVGYGIGENMCKRIIAAHEQFISLNERAQAVLDGTCLEPFPDCAYCVDVTTGVADSFNELEQREEARKLVLLSSKLYRMQFFKNV